MLNSIIKFDLHIHSKASAYKEEKNIVELSTIDNLPVLFQKLQDNRIDLISFTDHNRFDKELYLAAHSIIENMEYPEVQGLLAGAEFDVKLEDGKDKCHIITIFNVNKDTREIDYKKIQDEINKELLNNKDDCYSKERFEKLLKAIGLDVILIAHQKQDLDNDKFQTQSLSNATDNPEYYIQVGYIDALEYHKNNVQGILINCLSEFMDVPLITGSDCHQWTEYPHHSESIRKDSISFSEVKMLPTFKGLLMAITSPKTRFDRIEYDNESFVKEFYIDGVLVELDNGINAVIGENGSGKSTLLKALLGETSEKHIKEIIKKSNLVVDEEQRIKKDTASIIHQSKLITDFNNNNLFKGNNSLFSDVEHESFTTAINDFAAGLLRYVKLRINKNRFYEELGKAKIVLKVISEGTYFIDVKKDLVFEENTHEERYKKLKQAYDILKPELDNSYYNEDQKKLINYALKQIEILLTQTGKLKDLNRKIEKIKNTITSKVDQYRLRIAAKATSVDRKKHEYSSEKNNLKSLVIRMVRLENTKDEFPSFPKAISGTKTNREKGFVFQTKAKYDGVYLKDSFYGDMFNQGNTEDVIKNIDEEKTLITAITSANRENYEQIWRSNLEKFLTKNSECESYIKEESTSKGVGNTLGEMSLAYYKYQTHSIGEWDLLIIDQPEDNVSNNRISKDLIQHFNHLRLSSKKQIIFVTHSPLLVVNLDVDNVIHLSMENNLIKVKSGCLEDEENDILGLIASTMDGGKENIEKRLKLYGKENRV